MWESRRLGYDRVGHRSKRLSETADVQFDLAQTRRRGRLARRRIAPVSKLNQQGSDPTALRRGPSLAGTQLNGS
jgi:hypothetical protein